MRSWIIGIGAAMILAAAQSAGATEASVDLGVFSKYVWRGLVLNAGEVAQTTISVDAGNGLSFATWANFDLTDENATETTDPKNSFSEVDLSVSYELPIEGPLGVSVAVAEYLYPNGDESTRDASVTISSDLPLSPALTLSYDFGLIEGFYAVLEFSQEFPVREDLTLTLGASIGGADSAYNNATFGVNSMRLNNGQVTAALDIALNESFGLTLSAQYAALLNGPIRDAAFEEYGDRETFVFGANLSYQF